MHEPMRLIVEVSNLIAEGFRLNGQDGGGIELARA